MGLLGISGTRGITGSLPSSGSFASSCSENEQFMAFHWKKKYHFKIKNNMRFVECFTVHPCLA